MINSDVSKFCRPTTDYNFNPHPNPNPNNRLFSDWIASVFSQPQEREQLFTRLLSAEERASRLQAELAAAKNDHQRPSSQVPLHDAGSKMRSFFSCDQCCFMCSSFDVFIIICRKVFKYVFPLKN